MNTEATENTGNIEFAHEFSLLLSKSGKTVNEISETTRISISTLKSLEQGDFDEVSTPVVAKGFIRNVCRLLGQSPETLLSLYESKLDLETANRLKPVHRVGGHVGTKDPLSHRMVEAFKQMRGSKHVFGKKKRIPVSVLAIGICVVLSGLVYYVLSVRGASSSSAVESQKTSESITKSSALESVNAEPIAPVVPVDVQPVVKKEAIKVVVSRRESEKKSEETKTAPSDEKTTDVSMQFNGGLAPDGSSTGL